MTFIIHFKDNHRETYSNYYDEYDEHERDAAWDDVYATFPNADYIEAFQYDTNNYSSYSIYYNICYGNMKMAYNNSAMTVEAKVVNPEVSKCFQALMDALNKQLDSYRK